MQKLKRRIYTTVISVLASLVARVERMAMRDRKVAMMDSGKNAAKMGRLTQYVVNLGEMSKHANTIIVPDRPNDLAGVVTTALGVGDSIAKAAAAK